MRYVQLRAFHYVATCGGFSKAAEELFLTQPAISDQVRKLEDEYDIILFNRQKRQVGLTEPGRALLEITRRLFDSEQQALELLSESRALRSGTLRIVADSAHHLLHLLPRFRATFPGVRMSIRTGNSQTVLDSLYRYEADLGVLGEMPASRDFDVLRLSSAPIVAFAPVGHPFAARGRAELTELAGQPLVLRERGSKTRRKLEEAAAAVGITLVPAIEAEGREAVREIVASGGGIGFVSAAEFGEDPRLGLIEIGGVDIGTMDEALVCLRERRSSKLVQAFFDLARDAHPA
ncbi:LysR substrate-binding domain-containing protein [Rhodovulum euryhalinum]|uniref:Aminoethylphosphonate catabolism LysR family transcriptional regulator n=1 Tax=Rhodovulum euryhalinum TaxID=35805 RepID=A0A4R2KSR1_9RHOB|nr:LysR substrate-binding domain-containing protein [Rhodovulum euryhalinum]TCO74076.1 aminoethylphosphonate catabolism LysR family transcriptional regulator [Rhodovulum euryhalinum]